MNQVSLPQSVRIVEVGPRDGLQNEPRPVSTSDKLTLIDKLADAGLRSIEATAFVSPKWVPQMADHADVLRGIHRRPGVTYPVLVPNMKGFEAAVDSGAEEVAVFGAASETFSQKNINCSIAESIARFEPVAAAAREKGVRVRGSISCSLGCPYQGEVPVSAVADVVRRLRDIGCDEIDIADTIGVGTPVRVQEVMRAAAAEFPLDRLSGHFHDTYGQALSNILASLDVGIAIFHASVAGLGGCPYAKGATGNVATEDVLYMLHGMGLRTGIDLDKVVRAGDYISQAIGRPNSSRVGRALLTKWASAADAAPACV